MKNIQIKDSYNIWNASYMQYLIEKQCYNQYQSYLPEVQLNRNYFSMCIEWWLHNIGYYVTKPFCSNERIREINLRCKDVDLEEWAD